MLRLIDSMTRRAEVCLTSVAGIAARGIVNAIAAEGGRGYFNVTLHTGATLCVYLEEYT